MTKILQIYILFFKIEEKLLLFHQEFHKSKRNSSESTLQSTRRKNPWWFWIHGSKLPWWKKATRWNEWSQLNTNCFSWCTRNLSRRCSNERKKMIQINIKRRQMIKSYKYWWSVSFPKFHISKEYFWSCFDQIASDWNGLKDGRRNKDYNRGWW